MKPHRQYIESAPGRTAVVRHHESRRFDFNWHHHPTFELTLIVRGHGTRLIGDTLTGFGPGDLVLLAPDLPHTWTSGTEHSSPVEAYFVHFERGDLGDWPESAMLDRLLSRSRRGTVFSGDLAEPRTLLRRAASEKRPLKHMIHFMSALDSLAADPDGGRPITSEAYAMIARSPQASSAKVERRLETVHAMVSSSYPQAIDFGLVADKVGMSQAGFSRFFRRATGRTFTTYVQEVRIAEACRLLAETELSVNQIAHEVGFGSLTHFNRVFRRLKNLTPSQWRQAVR